MDFRQGGEWVLFPLDRARTAVFPLMLVFMLSSTNGPLVQLHIYSTGNRMVSIYLI